jgi:hypothetical protein
MKLSHSFSGSNSCLYPLYLTYLIIHLHNLYYALPLYSVVI